jgi:mono/diheme cytochrome c family protein
VLALSTTSEIGLAVVAGAFILFALVSSFVLPSRYPNFPGKHLGWFVVVSILFFVAMISAVLFFGQESEESSGGEGGTTAAETTTAPAGTTTTSTTTAATQGDPTAGKAVFTSAGCGGCHTLKAAGSTGTVGPNLDQLKPSFEAVQRQVETGGGPMPSFKDALSAKQIQDVAAFVVASTQS